MQIMYRKGDLVSVQGVVKYDQALPDEMGSPQVVVELNFQSLSFSPEDVTMVRQHFKVGEQALEAEGLPPVLHPVKVLSLDGDFAWIIDRDECRRTVLVRTLVRQSKGDAA